MAVNFLDNIDYGGKKPNFSRDQFETIDAMNSYDPAYLDEGHISYCKEDKKHYSFDGNIWKLFVGSGSAEMETIEWDYNSNANTFIEAGTYRIKGERTGNMLSDNLPIMNSGSGHTIDGILVVLDSSLPNGSGNVDDCTITQLLMLSNRVGGQEGDMYMRSAYGATKDNLTWKPWEKYQTNMEVGAVNNSYFLNPESPTTKLGDGGMNSLTANGIYSGIYYPPTALIGTPSIGASLADTTAIETFTMVVINNSIVAKENSSLVQIKFSITMGGVFSAERRIARWNADSNAPNGGTWNFSNSVWESISGSGELTNPNYHFNRDTTKLILGSQTWGGDHSEIGKKVSIGENVFLPSDLSFSTSAEGLHIKIGSDTWTISNIG